MLSHKGQEEAEHSFCKGAGFPVGDLSAGPDEMLRCDCCFKTSVAKVLVYIGTR
jgi:hypothetical protein